MEVLRIRNVFFMFKKHKKIEINETDNYCKFFSKKHKWFYIGSYCCHFLKCIFIIFYLIWESFFFLKKKFEDSVLYSLFKVLQLKGTVSRYFWLFFWLKRLDLGPIWTGKNDFANFFVFAKIFTKNVCPYSQQLPGHHASLANDYADTVSA